MWSSSALVLHDALVQSSGRAPRDRSDKTDLAKQSRQIRQQNGLTSSVVWNTLATLSRTERSSACARVLNASFFLSAGMLSGSCMSEPQPLQCSVTMSQGVRLMGCRMASWLGAAQPQ